MKFYSQCCFTYSDGTSFLLSKEFESESDAASWLTYYIDLFSDFSPVFDLCELDDDLEEILT